jgi:hypothetical protein
MAEGVDRIDYWDREDGAQVRALISAAGQK